MSENPILVTVGWQYPINLLINYFIQQRCIKLLKSDIYNIQLSSFCYFFIRQRFLKIVSQFPQINVFNIDNNEKDFLRSKSAY